MNRRASDLVRGGIALMLLLAIVGLAPVLLFAIPGALGLHLPAGGFWTALTRPDDGSLLLLALVAVGWICWAAFALATITEAAAALRGLPAPRLPGLAAPQRAAGALVAAVALLTSAPPANVQAPAPPAAMIATSSVSSATSVARVATAATRTPATAPKARTHVTSKAAVKEHAYHEVLVQRHDSLWRLAETHLGAGERWTEIYQLNRGRTQPDGRVLQDPDWIYPGWRLRLPLDPDHAAPHRHSGPTAGSQPRHSAEHDAPRHESTTHVGSITGHDAGRHTYRVRTGDTLWDIAATRLGDPTRWQDLYRLNKNQPQPDSGKLTDPRLIMPGWRLRLPNDPDTQVPQTDHQRREHESAQEPATPHAAPAPTGHSTPTAAPGTVLRPPTPAEPAPAGDSPKRTPTPDPRPPTIAPRIVAADDDSPASESAVLPLLALGLTAATLTGLVGEIRRRRRRQQSSRRPGQRIPMPEPAAAEREVTARTHSIPGTTDTLRRALRALQAACAATGRSLPDLLLIHAAPDGLRLQLTTPDNDAVAPFTAVDEVTWLLTSDPDQLPASDTDPYPTLVTLGVADNGMLLVNLEAIGTLTLTGDVDRIASALRAFAVDLSVGPFSNAATLTVTGPMFDDLAATLDPGRSHSSAAEHAARQLASHAAALTGLLDGQHLRGARTRGIDDTTRPVILLSQHAMPDAAQPWSGTVLIHHGGGDSQGWCLHLPASGPAHLAPANLDFDPQQLSEDDYRAIIDLLATADIEPGYEPDARCESTEAQQQRVRDALPAPPVRDDVAAEPRSPSGAAKVGEAPRVLVLGPIEVCGVHDARVPHRNRRLTELVAYLTLHPEATGSQISAALWPGRRIELTNRTAFISRTRQWLGHDSDDQPYLSRLSKSGRFSLSPAVTSDWHDFLQHARTGLDTEDIDELQSALSLVRGKPFLGIEDDRYAWAENDIQQMVSTIVDVSHTLAQLHLKHDAHRDALRAALLGLEVDDLSEELLTLAAQAARDCGEDDLARRLHQRHASLADDWDGLTAADVG